ncbi:serine hydrolase [Salinithrix halophila]|uniref:Serine hydrolase n=1 Tax=Salinithrix halophila TaxID=1485204 RepID=A0ABV8JHV8_9BACL
MTNGVPWRKAFSVTLGLSLLSPLTVWGDEGSPKPMIETWTKKSEVGVDVIHQATGRPKSWDNPGRISPVLHPGSPRSAGMANGPLDAMDSFMEQEIQKGITPGAVVLIARRGAVVKVKAYGNAALYSDDQKTPLETPVPMRKDTIFDLASISKVFTSTAAMKLYEEGKFNLDDPVAKYIPEFAQNGKDKVTIRQLMTHTSGFEPWIPLWEMGNSREERMQIVFAHPLKDQPGSTYTYSDLNMVTLGALVEKLSGKGLDTYIKEAITGPLGMKDTMYNPPSSLRPRIAATEYQSSPDRGMVWGSVHDENAWSLGGVAGHAGVFSTARDLAIFAHTMLNGGKYGKTRVLKPETVKLMEVNQNQAFPGHDHGLGWELNEHWYMDALADIETMGHTGYTGTALAVSRKNAAMVITLTNRVHPTRNTPSINPVRRHIARMAADAISVPIPGKRGAWFGGYGDNLNRSLTSEEFPASESRTLAFETWYRTEAGLDYGSVEGSSDGKEWTALTSPFTGNSQGWEQQVIKLPEGVKFLRFRYHTDGSGNGRGWYVKAPRITNAQGKNLCVGWAGDGWEVRKR